MSDSRLLTIKEVAEIFSLSVSRVRYEVFRKRMPFIKLGRSVRFRRGEIEAWISANTSGGEHQ